MASSFLVTGGCGFIGARLVADLVEAGHAVTVIDDLSLGSTRSLGKAVDSVRVVEVDVRDANAVARASARLRPDHVIHLAAMHFIPACDRDPKRCVDVNVGGTQAVLEACVGPGVQSVVLASSAAVYAPATIPHREDSPLGPTDIYGLTKLWTEQLGERFSKLTEIPVRVARLFNVFGPGETNPHLIPSVITQARASSELHLGNLETARDYVFVGDVADALSAMAVAPSLPSYSVMNVGRGEESTGHDIVTAVGELLELTLRVSNDPARVRLSDRPHLRSDPLRAHDWLGWRAETNLSEGLRVALPAPMAEGTDRLA